jgi:hypothetical protein
LRRKLAFDAYVADLLGLIGGAQRRAADISRKDIALGRADADDLAIALRQVPSRFRLSKTTFPHILARTLAEHFEWTRLNVDERTGALRGVASVVDNGAQNLRPWHAGGGMPRAPRHAIATELLIHVRDQNAFGILEIVLDMVPDDGRTVSLVAGLPNFVEPLQDLVLRYHRPGIQVLPRPELHVAEAAALLAGQEGSEFMAIITAIAEAETPLTLSAPESGVMSALLSGAAEAYLESEQDCPAVLACKSLGDRSEEAERHAEGPFAVYAPRFSGVYRRNAVRRFSKTVLPTDIAPLDPADWDSLASLRFVASLPLQAAPVMLPPLPII